MDITHNKLITCSTDHSAKVFNLANPADMSFNKHCKQERELYSKRYGHTEWVVKGKVLHNNKVVSIGMDSKVLLWHESRVMCADLNEMAKAHIASLTDLKVDKNHGIGFVSD